jgi:hypothetical protein
MPQIIMEKRNTIAVGCYIEWLQKKAKNSAFAYSLYRDDILIKHDVFPCRDIYSTCQLELIGILTAFKFVTEAVVVVKTTQPVIISGINMYLNSWIDNERLTKDDCTIKYADLWLDLYNAKDHCTITALQLEEPEAKKLQFAAKSCITII